MRYAVFVYIRISSGYLSNVGVFIQLNTFFKGQPVQK